MPPAVQEPNPFGADLGGVSPLLIDVRASAAFDSWLTVGLTDGDSASALGSIGIEFAAWNTNGGLNTDNGAVFWMDPSSGV